MGGIYNRFIKLFAFLGLILGFFYTPGCVFASENPDASTNTIEMILSESDD